MIPLFSATKRLPSEAKRTATGRVRPSIAIESVKPEAAVGGLVVPVEDGAVVPAFPNNRPGGLTGFGRVWGVGVGPAAAAGDASMPTAWAATRTIAIPS